MAEAVADVAGWSPTESKRARVRDFDRQPSATIKGQLAKIAAIADTQAPELKGWSQLAAERSGAPTETSKRNDDKMRLSKAGERPSRMSDERKAALRSASDKMREMTRSQGLERGRGFPGR